MATYKQIFGKQVKFLSSDPTNEGEGQIWYNSTSGTFKTVLVSEAWSSSAALSTGRGEMASGGTQTASIASFGGTPNSNAAEEYNGSGWATLPNGNTARRLLAATAQGTPSAFMAIGGYTTTYSNLVEEYNGSSWTANPTINTARYAFAGGGTATSALAFGGDVPGGPRSNASETWNGSSWTATPSLSTARNGIAGCGGSNTAGLAFGGDAGPPGEVTATEEYNGTSWTAGGSLPVAMSPTGAGIQTSALAVGGAPAPNNAKTFSYDGSSWTAVADLGTGRNVNRAAGAGNTAGLAMGGYPGLTTTEEYNRSADVTTAAAWASGGTYPFNAGDFSGAGTQTAAIAFGGKIYPGPNAVTNVSASYDGASWTVGPSITTARGLAASAKNGTTTAALCTGGYEPALSDKCEEFNGSSWTEGPNYPVSAQFGDQGVGTQTAALISGGYGGAPGSAYLDATSTYNGSSWTALSAPSNLQDSRFSATATGTSTAGLMLAGIGGAGKVESWNGSAWSEQAEALTARTQGGSSGPSTDALYFGGEGPTGVTEGFDGTAWSTRPTMGTARFSLASCGTSTLALATGGFTSSNSTEEFTGDTTAGNYKTITTS